MVKKNSSIKRVKRQIYESKHTVDALQQGANTGNPQKLCQKRPKAIIWTNETKINMYQKDVKR